MNRIQTAVFALSAMTANASVSVIAFEKAVATATSDHAAGTRGRLAGSVEAIRPQDFQRYTANAVVRSTDVQKMGVNGKGVTIAVIDSGIDATHPDLKSAIVDEACFCTGPDGTPCCPDGTSRQFGRGAAVDEIGHGTHMAGIIAGRGRKGPLSLIHI